MTQASSDLQVAGTLRVPHVLRRRSLHQAVTAHGCATTVPPSRRFASRIADCGIMNRLERPPSRPAQPRHILRLSHSWGTQDGIKRRFSADIHQELGRGHGGRNGRARRPSTRSRCGRRPAPTNGCGSASSASAAGPRRISTRPSSCRTRARSKSSPCATCSIATAKKPPQKINRGTKNKPKQIADYRDIVNDKSIDAVVHRHARSLARQANDRRASRPASTCTAKSR